MLLGAAAVVAALLVASSWYGYYGLGLFLLVAGGVSLYLLRRNAAALPAPMSKRKSGLRAINYPPPYPNAWYCIAFSDEVKKGDVKPVECLGQNLVVFRGENGAIGVLDAYCPHLGANMALGGQVVGDSVSCPFHKWEFRGSDGKCVRIPYQDKIPNSAVVRAWEVIEYNGLICIYYDAEGRKAPYHPPEIKQIKDNTFVYRDRYLPRNVKMHLQEFAENSADFRHIAPLHSRLLVPFTTIRIPFIDIFHQADWVPANRKYKDVDIRTEDDADTSSSSSRKPGYDMGKEKQHQEPIESDNDTKNHIAYFLDTAYLMYNNKPIPNTTASAEVTFVGPALYVFHFHTPLGEIILFQTNTPVKPIEQAVRFSWFADKKVPRLLVYYVVGNWIAQWKNDLFIWENKVWLHKPLLVKNDGPIMKLRRWFAQFYSENSYRPNENSLEW